MLRKYLLFLLVLFGLSITKSSHAVINVGLQPNDLYQRYLSVISTTVQSVNVETSTIQLVVNDVFKGEYTKGEVVDTTILQKSGLIDSL